MENENNQINCNLNEKIEINENKIFNLDYENQNLDNNINYLKWKDSIIKEYGNKTKLFKCKKCKILFYSTNEEIIKTSYYTNTCPKCKKHICYFCFNYSENKYLYCCKRRVINILFFISGPNYIKDNDKIDCDNILFLIPIINIIGLSFCANNILFLSMTTSSSKYDPLYEYMTFLIPLVLFIPYFFIDIYHIIFIFLISIPFKFVPLKYYNGIFDSKFKYFNSINS